jgi:hypothetical protein
MENGFSRARCRFGFYDVPSFGVECSGATFVTRRASRMKTLTVLGALGLLAWMGGAPAWAQQSTVRPTDWRGYQRGVRWEKSLEAAQERALREGKPILLYQLVGDLNREGC